MHGSISQYQISMRRITLLKPITIIDAERFALMEKMNAESISLMFRP